MIVIREDKNFGASAFKGFEIRDTKHLPKVEFTKQVVILDPDYFRHEMRSEI
jgi:predicted ester cyclase